MQMPLNLRLTLYTFYFILVSTHIVHSIILTPPYFNLVTNKKIHATATCGEGVSEPERFCKLTGATGTFAENPNHAQLIQGQFCDVCDPNDPSNSYPITNAIDGTNKWWQSPPLSRSLDYQQVNVTIDLGQLFHVAYIYITMGNSPRPAVWVLERSTDYGETYTPWQYFAEHTSDCKNLFDVEPNKQIDNDNEVVCTTAYSKVTPLEGGEIVVSLVNNRPSSKNFSNSDVLQEWTRATNVRLRLLRTKSLYGHLMGISRQDQTVTRRYFYSIRDISIGGRCVCNGHAQDCDVSQNQDLPYEVTDPNKLVCSCQHNTCGDHCEKCCDGFVQKKWRQNREKNEFICEPCQCFGHSDECEYDEEVERKKLSIDIYGVHSGGGVCRNCRDNTAGINCEKCADGYFRPPGVSPDSPNACLKCQCDERRTTGNCSNTGVCECKPNFLAPDCNQCAPGYTNWPLCEPCKCNIHGRADFTCDGAVCNCKPGYEAPRCDRCTEGFYDFPNCTECDCEAIGVIDYNCDQVTGQCVCRAGYVGKRCDQCDVGFYGDVATGFELCDCSENGVTDEKCDSKTGVCKCKENYAGAKCDECAAGFYNYPQCLPCECDLAGSKGENCTFFGVKQCLCNEGRGGAACDQCAPGYYQFPQCLECRCDEAGSAGQSCDLVTGKCRCKPNFSGDKCDECAPNLFNFPICEECRCHPDGVKPEFPGCDKALRNITLMCPCKEHVTGRQCDKCKERFFGLSGDNENGCQPCACSRDGTLNELDICNHATGQCECKHFVGSLSCSECQPGTYLLKRNNILGCEPCECRIGSSVNNFCDRETGSCSCLTNIIGDKCETPDNGHYIPDLHHLKYEIEDGYTPNRNAVRYEFDNEVFPGFSWKGYVNFKELENEVSQDIQIDTLGSYRMILRFINKNPDLSELFIRVQEHNSDEQSTTMFLPSTSKPAFATVIKNLNAVTFELAAGKYTVTFKTDSDAVYIDYFVLLPSDYFEPTILKKNVEKVCELDSEEPCIRKTYIPIDTFTSRVLADDPMYDTRKKELQNIATSSKKPVYVVRVDEHDDTKVEIKFPKPNSYILLIEYHNSGDDGTEVNVNVEHSDDGTRKQDGKVYLYKCNLDTLCRQIVLSNEIREPLIVDGVLKANVKFRAAEGGNVDVHRVIAIPKERFHINYIKMEPKCTMKNKVCLPIEYISMPDLIKEDLHTGAPEERTDLTTNIINGRQLVIADKDAKLVYLNDYFKEIRVPLLKNGYKPGNKQDYVMIIHYYQPNNPLVDVSVNIDDTNKGSFQAPYCPSISGCRAIVKFENGEIFDYENAKNVVVKLASDDKDIWLNYALVGPAVTVTPDLMRNAPIDLINDFISQCASQHFSIEFGKSKFCDDSVFSLSAKYNNGAKPCECNTEGSKSTDCQTFGGQCECKDNVIGRQCTKCQTGYYGFPDCKKCNCPGRNCDDKTGKCACPANVIQDDNCNICSPGYFGFHPEHGCVPCNCNKEGIVSGSSGTCDAKNGQCECKDHIGGQSCDKCKPGFYNYPECMKCNCNVNGTSENICDAYGSCVCKEHLHDPTCETCADGTFNLEARNPKGCTRCFCFGQTERCGSSPYFFKAVKDMNAMAWKTNKNSGVAIEKLETDGVKLSVDKAALDKPQEPIYWVAPAEYLGKKAYSYGGSIRYSLLFTSEDGSGQTIPSPDLILSGSSMTIAYRSLRQPTKGEVFSNSVDLIESQFSHLSNGVAVSRDQLINILNSLSELKIRASSHLIAIDSAELHNVELDFAVSEDESDRTRPALSVERCECPPNYRGLSCESCQPGYYKQKGSKLGSFTCVKCNCNDRADTCDEETGECIGCRDNTEGSQCERCKVGYYGRQFGNYLQCNLCPCPGPLKNFANNCTIVDDSVTCSCQKGYAGQYCSNCAAGYYGNPHLPSDEGKCLPCNCNGNIDTNDIGSCDQTTGKCLKCLRNTAGDQCEKCKDWHFGDPIGLKNCLACKCDKCGSESCDAATGNCVCKPNVKGPHCTTCAENTWGFNSCEGCKKCNCDPVGSISQQCDTITGNCFCKPGVGGKHCNMCEPDYWNFTSNGCQPCNCEKFGVQSGMSGIACNNKTGDCKCIPGVKGKYCDECDDRWILVQHRGCVECDTCVHTLLDDTDELLKKANNIENRNSSLAIKAFDKLEKLEELYAMLNSATTKEELDNTPLIILKNKIQKMRMTGLPDLNYIPYDIEGKMKEFNATYNEAKAFNQEISSLRNQMDEISTMMNDLDKTKGDTEVTDGQLSYYNETVTNIMNLKFNETIDEINNELNKFSNDKLAAEEMVKKYQNQLNELEKINNKSKYIENSINELKTYIETAKNIEKFKEKDVTFKAFLDSFESIRSQSNSLKDNTTATQDSVRELVKNLKDGLNNGQNELGSLEESVKKLTELHADHIQNYDELEQKVKNARQRSDELAQLAKSWEDRVEKSRTGLQAFEIAHVYDTIASALNTAHTKSKEVLENYEEASRTLAQYLEEVKSLNDRNNEVANKLQAQKEQKATAESNYNSLQKTYNELEATLNNLNKDIEKIEAWVAKTQQNENALNEIKKELDADEKELQESEKKAKDLERKIQSLDSLKEKISTNTTDNRNLLNQIDESIDDIKKLNSNISERVDNLMANNKGLDDKVDEVNDKINKLKLLIESTRNIANEIKVAVQFKNSSFIKLRNAPVFAPSISNVGSLYLKTTDTNAPISLLYNQKHPNTYMSLYLKDGAPYLQYRLSEKSQPTIVSTNNRINDDRWYKLELERIGRVARLKVFSEKHELLATESNESKDDSVVFNIDSMNANFYLGQFRFPDGRVPSELQEALTHNGQFKNQFQGAIDTVTMNRHSFGLWNHEEANDITGAIKRTHDAENTTESVQFNEGGFFCFNTSAVNSGGLTPRPKVVRKNFDITVKFRTPNPHGLLWYGHDDRKHILIYLRDGHIVTEYITEKGSLKLDSSTAEFWDSDTKLNDNKFHVIHVNINFNTASSGNITVTEKEIKESVSGTQLLARTVRPYEQDFRSFTLNEICIGGVPNSKVLKDLDVETNSFYGCYEYFFSKPISTDRVKLKDELLKTYVTSFGVDSKCSDVVDQCSFEKSTVPTYVSFDTTKFLSVDYEATLGISFVPHSPSGSLLFLRQSELQDGEAVNYIHLYLENLYINLVVKNTQKNEVMKLVSSVKVNYNELNHVYVVKNDADFTLNVNDNINKQSLSNKDRIFTNSDLFVGGVPENQRAGISGQFYSFEGCVIDVLYKDKVLKFENVKKRSESQLGFSKCYIPKIDSFASGNGSNKANNPKGVQLLSQVKSAKDEECTLSKNYDQSIVKPIGTRFGLTKNSRMEVLDDHMDKFNSFISFKFRTILSDGLIFYATDAPFENFIAIWLQDGYLNYAFDSGSGPLHIKSKETYNDGRYHTVIAIRNKEYAKLSILDRSNVSLSESLEDYSPGAKETLNVIGPYYIGGVPEDVVIRIPETQTQILKIEPFIGCMFDFIIGYKPLKNRVKRIDIMNCSNSHESGVFFTGNSPASHANLVSHISMKDSFELEMDIKPRTKNGLLLYIGPKEASNKDYATLELIRGELVYQIYYGGMPYSVKYVPKVSSNELCNANWIRIKLKKASNGRIVLSIKNEELVSNNADLLPSSSKFNTLFLGGLPNLSLYSKVSVSKEPFVGCIRDLIISQGSIKNRKVLLDLKLEEDVLNYCPLK